MANIIGLALKVTGDASGLAKSLTPVDRALDKLAAQAEKATNVFTPFAEKTAAAGKAQEEFAAKFSALADQLRDNVVGPQEYAAAFGRLTEEAKATAAAFAEGLRITDQVRTAEELRVVELAKLESLLSQGAISQETFVRASEKATGVEKERADAAASAARIIAANLSPQERYSQQMQELGVHLEAGRLSQDQFNRAAQKAKTDLDGIGKEAGKADKNIEQLNKNVNFLKNVEIGRLVFDGVRALGNAFASVQNQISGLVTSVNSSIDQLNDFSQRTGIGVEALQGYSLAAKLAGVDTEQFGTAIQKLAVNIGKATPGDALDKSLRAINLSVSELRALAPEEQFSAIGNAISTLPTVADRAAAAVEIFGKQGAALAPLFREGAASIEELQARAEKLGLIVDEAQVNNVASMNDAFDLVAATVQGITGQVLGNLAPAVTDVTNQFLKFVEEFAGVDGKGGTGIANAITDTLLRGAEYFAGVFDEYVQYFGGFTAALTTAGETFNQISGVLEVLSGVFKSIFNTFEIIGNGIAVALGKALEAIGSYVSTDLENFGRDLQLNASSQLQQNLAELESAGQQIVNGTTQAVFGNAAEQQAAAAGAATTYLEGLRAQIERERSPQFKIETDIEQTRERFDSFFNGVVDQSSAVTNAMRGFEAAAASVADPLNITADEIARIKVEQDKVNRAVDQELQSRQAIKDAAIVQADADAKRIADLTKASDAQTKLAEDLAAVDREQARVQEQLQAARQAASQSLSESDRKASQDQADAAAASLASLDQIEAKLKETQRAAKQGFSDGFTKQFEETGKAIDAARAKAADFGKAGVSAQLALADAVTVLQEKARAGFLNKAEYDKELARQQGFFDEALKREQENQRRLVDLKQAANVRVEEFLRGKIDERAKFEIARQEEIANRRQKAIENVAAIEERIAVQQKSVQAARSSGDLASARARSGELRTLRQAQVAEQRIAEGRNQAGRNQGTGLAGGLQQVQQFQNRIAQTNENFLRAFSGTYATANASLNQANAVAAELARQQELSRPVAGSVSTADIRTAEGAALVLGLGAAAQDPNLIEARLQTKQLTGIRTAITNAVTGYIGTVAEIF
jgi:archaellum component FlaC